MENTIARNKRVFLVEDSPALRTRLVEMVRKIDGVTIVGEADSPTSAIAGILRADPDCVVLDIRLIGGSGLDVLRKIKPDHPQMIFIVLTNYAEQQYRENCMAQGADYFFDKSSEFARVKEVIAARVAECGRATTSL